jgi:hypothetical protein
MIPGYFTSYAQYLQRFEVAMDERLAALKIFDDAVKTDWEYTRRKCAILLLDEVKQWLENYFKKQENNANVSNLITFLPNDLQRLCTNLWIILSSGEEPEEVKQLMAVICQTPNNASQLLAAIEKIRSDLQTAALPADKTASRYAGERLTEAIREAVQRATTFNPVPSRTVFRKAT